MILENMRREVVQNLNIPMKWYLGLLIKLCSSTKNLSKRLIDLDSILGFAVTFNVSLYLTVSGGKKGQLQLPLSLKKLEIFIFF